MMGHLHIVNRLPMSQVIHVIRALTLAASVLLLMASLPAASAAFEEAPDAPRLSDEPCGWEGGATLQQALDLVLGTKCAVGGNIDDATQDAVDLVWAVLLLVEQNAEELCRTHVDDQPGNCDI